MKSNTQEHRQRTSRDEVTTVFSSRGADFRIWRQFWFLSVTLVALTMEGQEDLGAVGRNRHLIKSEILKSAPLDEKTVVTSSLLVRCRCSWVVYFIFRTRQID